MSAQARGAEFVVVLLMALLANNAPAQTTAEDPIEQLRREIRGQQETLDRLLLRLDVLERERSAAAITAQETKPSSQPKTVIPPEAEQRDQVGDLNAIQVKPGETPGSIMMTGPRGVSVGIGGFIKTLAFYDNHAEESAAIFYAANLGTTRDDQNGGSALTAELSRMNFDTRARAGDARVRAYIEFDFKNNSFNWRHGYMSWDDKWGQVLAGKYWSNFMDLQSQPESLSEPSLSGSIFSRQAQIRYTRRFHRGWKWTVAMEDPDSNDVIAQDSTQTRTAWPDITSTISASGERSHIQLGGLVRRITIDPDNASNFGTTGWGVHLSGHVDFGSREKLAAVFVAGQGLGRYMLGLSSTAGAFVDVDDGLILKRRAIGGFTTLRHKWNSPCRSTVGIGYATAETNPLQADDAFRASMIGIANLLCSVNRSITIGGEYEYGRRWNINRALDNNRFIFGLQLF